MIEKDFESAFKTCTLNMHRIRDCFEMCDWNFLSAIFEAEQGKI